jgi:zinc protease
MLRRRIALLCPLLLTLSLACEKPPATDTTTPPADTNAPPAEAPLPTVEEVLAQSIEALGGRAAIDAVKSSYTESKTEIKAQGISILTRIWAKGDDFYFESEMPGVPTSQVWKKGDEIWSKDAINGLRKLEGKEAFQARWSSDPLLAANWKEYFDTATLVGRKKEGDREVYEVALATTAGDELVLLFDAETGLPAGQMFEQETPMGAMTLRVTLGDFREVQGVKVPFRSVTDMQLMSAVQTTEKYEVNVEIDETKLQLPSTEPPAPAPEPEPAKGKTKTKTKAAPKAAAQ